MAGTFTNLQYHIVFSTKNRKPWISEELRPRIYEYMGGTIRAKRGILYEIEGTPDHVHLLIRWRPDDSVSDLVRDIKNASSGWVHDNFPELESFRWQEGFGAFTVSHSQADKVKAYIIGQEEHHREKCFKNEYIALLKAHQVDYDERYVWKYPSGGITPSGLYWLLYVYRGLASLHPRLHAIAPSGLNSRTNR